MITNREEVIDKAFGVFLRMNYEKASIITIAKACGLTKTGIVYYFPHKLDLFVAVTDKYVLRMHEPESKFPAPADTLAEFIGQYVAGVDASMKRIAGMVGDNLSPHAQTHKGIHAAGRLSGTAGTRNRPTYDTGTVRAQ